MRPGSSRHIVLPRYGVEVVEWGLSCRHLALVLRELCLGPRANVHPQADSLATSCLRKRFSVPHSRAAGGGCGGSKLASVAVNGHGFSASAISGELV